MEGGKLHVPMTAAVAPVHQPRLGGGVDFIQQALHRQLFHLQAILPEEIFRHDAVCSSLKLRNAVEPPGGAAPARCAANDAVPALSVHQGAFQFHTVSIRHIHVKQPPHGGAVFQFGAEPFQLQRRSPCHKIGFAARDRLPRPAEEHAGKAFFQPFQPPVEAAADQGGILHRAGDVHGEADHGAAVCFQQVVLEIRPPFPGQEHLAQGHFLINNGSHPFPFGWRR